MDAKLSTLALLAMGGLLATSPTGAQVYQSYTFTDLGASAGRYSLGEAVSNSGEMAGVVRPTTSLRYHATVWQDGTPLELESLGGSRSEALDINNRDQTVGWAELPNRGGAQPTIWNGTKLTPLATLGGGGFANAINNRSEVAGEVNLPTGGSRAAVWKGTKLTELDTLGGAYNSAQAINNRGQAAGYSDLPSGYQHAVLWNGKAATDLGTLGGHSSFANAINDRGQVVGSSNVNPNDNYSSHATLWNGTEATDLGTLGGRYSFAYSINNAGLVVGTSDIASSSEFGENHATLWTRGTAIDLNGFLDAKTVNEGWVLTQANDINDKGWIVGNAANSLLGITTHAFLLTPSNEGVPGITGITASKMLTAVPEPQTYAMFLAGLGLIAGTLLRHRKAA